MKNSAIYKFANSKTPQNAKIPRFQYSQHKTLKKYQHSKIPNIQNAKTNRLKHSTQIKNVKFLNSKQNSKIKSLIQQFKNYEVMKLIIS